MNSSAYVFGKIASGYVEYPDNSYSVFIKKLYKHCKAQTQVIIHRDDSLMCYCYVRKLQDNRYIGLASVVNGYYTSDIATLFSIFEKAVEKMAEYGYFIQYADDGTLIGGSVKVNGGLENVHAITEYLEAAFRAVETSPLPHVNYSVEKEAIRELCVEDNKGEVVKASYTYGYTCVYKNKDFDTVRVSSYRGILSRLQHEIEEISGKYMELKRRYNKQERQNRFHAILLLLFKVSVVICICVVGCLFYQYMIDKTRQNLNNTRENLVEAQRAVLLKGDTLTDLRNRVYVLEGKISDLQFSLSREKDKRKETEGKLSELEEVVENFMPLLITDVEVRGSLNDAEFSESGGGAIYSSNAKYLKPQIKYMGISVGGVVPIKVKLYTPSGTLSRGSQSPSDCTLAIALSVEDNEMSTLELPAWKHELMGNWDKGIYRYEFWYGDVCLKSKTFTVC